MTHDPLCPCQSHKQPHIQYLSGVCHYCQCDLIAKVRTNQEVETLSDVADAAILFLGYTGDEVRKLTVDALDMLRNSR